MESISSRRLTSYLQQQQQSKQQQQQQWVCGQMFSEIHASHSKHSNQEWQ
jgi:DNA topoisomerase VI subunit B